MMAILDSVGPKLPAGAEIHDRQQWVLSCWVNLTSS